MIVPIIFYCVTLSVFASPLNLPALDGRIVGGVSVDIEDFPYQASLQFYGSYMCGASIIAPTWILTAAHCTDGAAVPSLSIRAGTSYHGYGGVVIAVKTVYQNPHYNSWDMDYDISILNLASKLTFSRNIAPIHLPSPDQMIPTGDLAIVSGWGTLTEGGPLPSKLQAVKVTVISNHACEVAYGDRAVTKRMMCAGESHGGKDACQGDSGGPLVSDGYLVGIVSWGYGCARPSQPGVYSNVAHLRNYITAISGI